MHLNRLHTDKAEIDSRNAEILGQIKLAECPADPAETIDQGRHSHWNWEYRQVSGNYSQNGRPQQTAIKIALPD